MKKLLGILLTLCLLAGTALAEDVVLIEPESCESPVTVNGDGIMLLLERVQGEVRLTLSLNDSLLLEQDYGEVGGVFLSEPIYLSENGEYVLTLAVGESLYVVTVVMDKTPAPTEISWL